MIKPLIAIILVPASLAVSTWSAEKEEKVTIDQVPPAVATALKQHAGGEKISGLSKEQEDGKTIYEAKFKKNGQVNEVSVDEAGAVVSVEETIAAADAPKAVREALEKEHPGAKIEKMERVKEGGKTSYEALVSSGKKRAEIVFSESGAVLEREDKTKDKD